MSIRPSPKYGLNPSLSVCFYCGDVKEIIIPGQLPGDVEAPHKAAWDKEPCDRCKRWMRKGVMLIETPDGQEDSQTPSRTGQIAVVRDEAIPKMINSKDLADQILRQRVAFLPVSVWDALGLPRKEIPEQD